MTTNTPTIIDPAVIAPVIGANNELAPKLPSLWAVIVHNDATTPFQLVCSVLSNVFNLDERSAFTIMLHAHETGRAVVDVSTKDIAETRSMMANNLSRQSGFELTFSIREETPE